MIVAFLVFVLCLTPIVSAQTPAAGPSEADKIRNLVQVIQGDNTFDTRLFGARELLTVQTPASEAALLDILVSGKSGAVMAVSQALADLNGMAPRSLIEPLVHLLQSPEAGIRESAINALASFRNEEVAILVGRVAANRGLNIAARQAALEVLRRTAGESRAVEAMVTLTRDPDERIRNPVFRTIEMLAQRSFDGNAADVEQWWRSERNRSPAERWRTLLQESDAELRTARGDLDDLQTRYLSALSTLYDQAPEDRKLDRLSSYLTDKLPSVRALGASLVSARVEDRKPVPDSLVASLALLIDDPDKNVRTSALLAIRALRRGELSARLVARWPNENDPGVRLALIDAIGRLGNPEALPFLIERTLPNDSLAVSAAAAGGLGRLCTNSEVSSANVDRVTDALLALFERLPPSEAALRSNVLDAMAAVGSVKFLPTFRVMIDDDAAPLRAAAIRGLANIGDRQQLDHVLSRISDEDASVRAVAIAAVGQLGRNDRHIEALVARLDPATEPVEALREVAWQNALRLIRLRPAAQQLAWAERLPAVTDPENAKRAIDLIGPLVAASSGADLDAANRLNAFERLGDALALLDRHADAQRAFLSALELVEPSDAAAGDRLAQKAAESMLRSGNYDALAAFVKGAAAASQTSRAQTALETVVAYYEADDQDETLAAGQPLLTQLAAAESANALDAALRLRFDAVCTRADEALDKQDRLRVQSALNDLALDDDPNSPAARTILDLGDRAVPILVDIARTHVAGSAAGTKNTGDTERCVAMLKRLRPDWPGFEMTASRPEKEAALESLLAARSAPTAGLPQDRLDPH